MMSVGLHCRLTGRPARAEALARFIDYVQNHERVWICRRIEIAVTGLPGIQRPRRNDFPLETRHKQKGGSPMTMRPDPTFYASPKLAMQAPEENFAYTRCSAPTSRSPTRWR